MPQVLLPSSQKVGQHDAPVISKHGMVEGGGGRAWEQPRRAGGTRRTYQPGEYRRSMANDEKELPVSYSFTTDQGTSLQLKVFFSATHFIVVIRFVQCIHAERFAQVEKEMLTALVADCTLLADMKALNDSEQSEIQKIREDISNCSPPLKIRRMDDTEAKTHNTTRMIRFSDPSHIFFEGAQTDVHEASVVPQAASVEKSLQDQPCNQGGILLHASYFANGLTMRSIVVKVVWVGAKQKDGDALADIFLLNITRCCKIQCGYCTLRRAYTSKDVIHADVMCNSEDAQVGQEIVENAP